LFTVDVDVPQGLSFKHIAPGIVTDAQGRSWTVVVRVDNWDHGEYSAAMLLHYYEIRLCGPDIEHWAVMSQDVGEDLDFDHCTIKVADSYDEALEYYEDQARQIRLRREYSIAEMKGHF